MAHVQNEKEKQDKQKEERKVIGYYMLGKTIGEGTFGKVKLGVHLPTGEKVAVKILEKSKIKEQADIRRVNREIKILKKAKHCNIIQLYEVLDTKSAIYLMMECCDGGEMFDYIVANRKIDEEEACMFFHQIIDAVEELHKNDITHRDLKPENLLLSDPSDSALLKIADFGLSAIVFATESSNTSSGGHTGKEKGVVTSSYNHKGITIATPPPPAKPPSSSSSSSSSSGSPEESSSLCVDGGGSTLRRLRSVVGSPHYIAPEISYSGINRTLYSN
jgi:serine/threonine protein kinase